MTVFNTLKKLGLASEETSVLFHKGVRDNPDLNVFKDISSGVIFIKDFYFGDEGYESGNYRKEKLNQEYDDLSIKDYERLTDCEKRISDFKPFYVGKDIIDFGCGHGDFLKASQNFTNSSSGVELQNSFIEKLTKNKIRCEKSIGEFKDQSIDTFFLFHSFEHLPDPLKVLQEIKSKLRNKGKLIIEVPHANDFLISTLKEESFIKFTLWSQHLILHTKNSLERFLEFSGFDNILIKGVQRYPFSNHLHWVSQKKPGGHKTNMSLLDTKELTKAYANTLSQLGANDTLIAIAENI